MSRKQKNFPTVLDQMGFGQSTQGVEILWKSPTSSPTQPVRSKAEILQRKDRFILDKFTAAFDLNKLSQTFETNARKKFQKVSSCSIKITAKCSLQIILEITPTHQDGQIDQRAAQNNPGTILGWTTSIAINQSNLALQVTDAFFVGTPITDWWVQISRIITESVTPGLSSLWRANNLFELIIPVYALSAKSMVDPSNLHEIIHSPLGSELKIPRPISVEPQASKITIQLAAPDNITELDYPIEILAARETASTWIETDKAIFAKQTSTLSSDLLNQPIDCLLARISAHPPLAQQLSGSKFDTSSFNEDTSLTVMTGGLLALAHLGRSHDLVKSLSITLRRVASVYGSLNELAPMRSTLPEILGDNWSTVDANRSFKSWLIALEQKPKNLRILHKIANLARETGDLGKEFDALFNICQLERRTAALQPSTLRLIEISEKRMADDSESKFKLRSLLEIAARKTAYNDKIVMTLSKMLCACGDHKKALALLESCIQSNPQQISPAQLADLHAEIGNIWRTHENNIPLATARFIAATTSPSEPSDRLLDDAEDFFTKTGNADQIKRLFLLRANRPGRQAPIEAIERSAKYMNKMNHHVESISAVVDLMKMNRYQQWYCDIILDAANITQINWGEIAELMQKADSKQLPKDTLPMWKLITGRCAMKNNASWMIGVRNFMDKHVVRLMSEDESRFVISTLTKHQALGDLSTFISDRLPFSQNSEADFLLQTIINENLFSTDGLFEQAIAQKASSTANLDMSTMRLKKLIATDEPRKIDIFIQSHVETITNNELMQSFIDQSIKAVCDTENQIFSDTVSVLLKTRDERAPFNQIEREIQIDNLIRRKFLTIAEDLLKTTIEAGERGTSRQDVVHNLLSNMPELIAKWHYIEMRATKDSATRHKNAKQCLKHWLSTESRPHELAEVIATLAETEVLDAPTLALLESISTREKNLGEFLRILSSQLDKNKEKQASYLYWAIRTINANGLDREIAARLYEKKSASLEENAIHKMYSQAQLWLSAKNLTEAQRHFMAILKDPEVLTVPEICFKALDGLAQTKPQRSQFATMVQSLIAWADSKNQRMLAEQLTNKSIELEIASLEHLHARITQKFDTLSAAQLATIAMQALAKSERSSSGIVKLLDEWKATKTIADHPEKWREVIACLTTDHLLRQLRRTARCEILFMHAKNLFEDETKRFDAIPHFEVIALENPLDSRTWIPLYSLYEECGAKKKMIAHLERIIPLIEQDTSLLEKTPFNIESLKNTLSRARKSVIEAGGLGGMDYKPPADPTKNNFELNNHAARLQRGWVDAIPIVKISAMNSDANPGSMIAAEQATTGSHTDQMAGLPFDGSAAPNLDSSLDNSQYKANIDTDESAPARVELSLITSAKTNPSRELINWRDLALSGSAPKGATKKVTTMAFASELEKHVAVQCVALLAAETSELANWHWQVWRHCNDFQYPTNDLGRIPKDLKFAQYGGQLHKLIKMVTPVILRVNKEKFIAERHLRKLGIQQNASPKQVDLGHPALKRGNLAVFNQHVTSSKLKFFDTQGLGSEVFFDLGQRAMYFDGKWQLELPPTVLAYRIMENLLYFQKGVPGVPLLNAETEIVPVIQTIRDVLSSSGIGRLRIAFGIDHAEINEQLKTINREQLVSLLGWNSDRTTNDIMTLQQEMRLKAYADLFGITLDLIGISESLAAKNLCESSNASQGPVVSQNPIVDFLIKLATRLKI
jgi:tetratricopeptide (TPR) repeat protein